MKNYISIREYSEMMISGRSNREQNYEKATVLKAILNNKELIGDGGLPEAMRIYDELSNIERNAEASRYLRCGGNY